MNLLKPSNQKEKQQQQLIIITFLSVAGYFALVYLPNKERQKLEMEIQTIINRVANAQPQDYSSLLTTCQNYLKWEKEDSIHQETLNNKREELNKAIDWLKQAEKRLADEKQQAQTQEEAEQKRKQAEIIKKRKFHWLRTPQSWADDYLIVDKGKYNSAVIKDTIEKAKAFNSFAHYKIHFPPNIWNLLTAEQKKLAKEKGHGELFLDEETKTFEFNDEISDWYDNVSMDPIRGEKDPDTKKDNNALFYGTEGTGKTSIVRKLTYETDCYPLVEIKGSTLSPNKLDSDIGVAPLEKFILTNADIEHTLEDDFGLPREANGEVRFILFVDEADLVSREARFFDPTYLTFLKECMEQINKEKQPEEDFFCEQCFKKIEAGKKFFYKKGKKNEKLCSQDCFLSYHGELCHKCCNYFLTVYQHWDKKGFPDVVYCSNCYDLAKKEWQEEEERWDKLTNRECRYCQAKTNSIFDVCEKQTCLDKMNEEIDKRRNNDPLPNNNDQQDQQRERERERAITTRH